jgi:hypothetical protein
MRGTRIEKEVEICATNLANKTKCMGINGKEKIAKFMKTCDQANSVGDNRSFPVIEVSSF